MCYEKFLDQLYEDRMEQKRKLEASRMKHRQSILDRQNSKHAPAAEVINSMPDTLPMDLVKLKELVSYNLKIGQYFPERMKDVRINLKAIKKFIEDNKL